jgi:hypothetical protein
MTTFSTLQADIIEWSARSDVSSKIAMFIRVSEAEIFRRVRLLEQETETTLTFASGDDYAADLPDGFLGFKSIFVDGASNPNTVYATPQVFHEETAANTVFADVEVDYLYTIEAAKVKIKAAVGATDPVTASAVYFLRPSGVTASNTTNVILTNHYDIYLWACLMQLWDWADEPEPVQKYERKFEKAVEEIRPHENLRRRPAGALVRRLAKSRVF